MTSKTIEDVIIFADGLDHPECVAVHQNGTVWAGGEGGQIYCIAEDGHQVKEVANTGGFVLGIAFSPDYSWLAVCDLKKQCVWRLDISTSVLSLLTSGSDRRKFITPNFPVFDKAGNLYVSDSGNFRQTNGCIYKITSDGNCMIWHEGPFSFSNGMALSADERTLYVVCTWYPGVEKITIDESGRAVSRDGVVKIPETCPDGIAIHPDGDLFVSCYAPNTIYRFDPHTGELNTLIHDWESHTICNPTNIAFRGDRANELFIANLGRWHIAKMIL